MNEIFFSIHSRLDYSGKKCSFFPISCAYYINYFPQILCNKPQAKKENELDIPNSFMENIQKEFFSPL